MFEVNIDKRLRREIEITLEDMQAGFTTDSLIDFCNKKNTGCQLPARPVYVRNRSGKSFDIL